MHVVPLLADFRTIAYSWLPTLTPSTVFEMVHKSIAMSGSLSDVAASLQL